MNWLTFGFPINIWLFIFLLMGSFISGFFACFLWISKKIGKLQKIMKNPYKVDKLLKDPFLQKQLEDLKKKIEGEFSK
ncbi:hypothetical protein [endosymbiont GvMRE of Glomus versiforme]|uniref:hypothetical protein n=1 Tax=endosymbiont GvMRE of Glomus versiforme TaxID=2039283 RepID=UPI000EDC0D5D|nr:hypothetical protein [endosymbiont GvMRE of Glomus versiforme]RHZ35496.1 hypothetical protein GvMRE_IIg359 [endosymbiont GvMRE of Glomus versiforme]